MSGEISKPERATYYVAGDGADVLHTGITEPHQVTTTGQPTLEGYEAETDYLGRLTDEADKFPPLPAPGVSLSQGEIYAYGDTLLMVRQSHTRTEHAPEDVPALFLVWREDADDVLAWVAGEQVYVGTRRTYEGVTYECVQAHVTEFAPPQVPALWHPVTEPTEEWQAGVAYTGDNTAGAGNGDVVTYEGGEYRCLQSHTSQVGWHPPAVPALWTPL